MKLYNNLPPMPKPEEEAELFRRVREGDAEARERLILGGMRVALHVARRYASDSAEFEEVVSECAVSLPRCVDLFDPEKGTDFFHYIYRASLNALHNVWKRKTRRAEMLSLDAPVNTRRPGRELTLADTIAVEEDISEAPILAEEYAFLRERIDELPPHYAHIVKEYYGFCGCKQKTQKELQAEMRVCQGGISRQKKNAVKKLRLAMIRGFY